MNKGMRVDPRTRFDSRYEVDDTTGCWIWTGAANGNGWATISINGKAVMAHRYAYETFKEPIPDNHSVRRICGNGRCVNPDHFVLMPKDPVMRFWFNVDKQEDHWIWKPSSFTYRVEGKSYNPRRYAHQQVLGIDQDFLYARCGEDRCVRPEHAGDSQDRFWSRVDKDVDGCWYWMGSKLASGYPHLTYNNESVYAHRLAYEWAGGSLEDGFILHHICGHKSCVRPAHLEQISYTEMVQIREQNRVPTVCPMCGKTYRNLKAHVRVHKNGDER